MGYYMRFIVTDSQPITLALLEDALQQVDLAYSISDVHLGPVESGHLTHQSELYGEIEICRPDAAEDEELEELKEDVEETGRPKAKRQAVLAVLNQAKAMVVIRVLWQGRDSEATLEKIDPIWNWLFANRQGMLHAEGEGYYDRTGLLLKVE